MGGCGSAWLLKLRDYGLVSGRVAIVETMAETQERDVCAVLQKWHDRRKSNLLELWRASYNGSKQLIQQDSQSSSKGDSTDRRSYRPWRCRSRMGSAGTGDGAQDI